MKSTKEMPKDWWNCRFAWNPITGFKQHRFTERISHKKERTIQPLE